MLNSLTLSAPDSLTTERPSPGTMALSKASNLKVTLPVLEPDGDFSYWWRDFTNKVRTLQHGANLVSLQSDEGKEAP